MQIVGFYNTQPTLTVEVPGNVLNVGHLKELLNVRYFDLELDLDDIKQYNRQNEAEELAGNMVLKDFVKLYYHVPVNTVFHFDEAESEAPLSNPIKNTISDILKSSPGNSELTLDTLVQDILFNSDVEKILKILDSFQIIWKKDSSLASLVEQCLSVGAERMFDKTDVVHVHSLLRYCVGALRTIPQDSRVVTLFAQLCGSLGNTECFLGRYITAVQRYQTAHTQLIQTSNLRDALVTLLNAAQALVHAGQFSHAISILNLLIEQQNSVLEKVTILSDYMACIEDKNMVAQDLDADSLNAQEMLALATRLESACYMGTLQPQTAAQCIERAVCVLLTYKEGGGLVKNTPLEKELGLLLLEQSKIKMSRKEGVSSMLIVDRAITLLERVDNVETQLGHALNIKATALCMYGHFQQAKDTWELALGKYVAYNTPEYTKILHNIHVCKEKMK